MISSSSFVFSSSFSLSFLFPPSMCEGYADDEEEEEEDGKTSSHCGGDDGGVVSVSGDNRLR